MSKRWVIVKKATGNRLRLRLLYFTSGNRLRLRLTWKKPKKSITIKINNQMAIG